LIASSSPDGCPRSDVFFLLSILESIAWVIL
jgi:hypothetical protein